MKGKEWFYAGLVVFLSVALAIILSEKMLEQAYLKKNQPAA